MLGKVIPLQSMKFERSRRTGRVGASGAGIDAIGVEERAAAVESACGGTVNVNHHPVGNHKREV
jgi:hypothetical protein